jgi:2-C-methyl-D-erythritol 4-phosphate cytidylyltransferase
LIKDLSKIKGMVAIVPGAGVGSRMQSDIPKQYLKIKDRSILGLTLNKLLSYKPIELVVLVVSPDDNHYQGLKDIDSDNIIIIEGGQERIHSVNNAIRYLYDNGLADDTPVMVHDAARPCLLHKDLEKLTAQYNKSQLPCMLVAPVVDSLQKVNQENQVESRVSRDALVRVLTPQMAKFIDIKEALKKSLDNAQLFTDEVSALTYAGQTVDVVYASNGNIKITRPEDLPIAEFFLEQEKESQK